MTEPTRDPRPPDRDDETATQIVRRPPGEPPPDLTDYRVVHRAMTVDLARLARAAAELARRPNPARMAELRSYLYAVLGQIERHHQVEDEHVWPLLAAAGRPAEFAALGDEYVRLDPVLRRVARLATRDRATPELVAALEGAAELLARHVAAEEREIFPLITGLVRVEDYRRLQRHFQANWPLAQLPFLLPWTFRHATTDERAALLGPARWSIRMLLTILEPGFRAREQRLFG